MTVTHWLTKVCESFCKVRNIMPVASKRVTRMEKYSIGQLYNGFSQEPMEISKKPASHTLLAYYLLSDIDQFVGMFG